MRAEARLASPALRPLPAHANRPAVSIACHYRACQLRFGSAAEADAHYMAVHYNRCSVCKKSFANVRWRA